MNQSPWEVNNRPADQEISLLLFTPEVCFRDDKSLPLNPILSQINPVHIFLSYLFKIYFNIIPVSQVDSSL
jgi:hypothetical protein